MKTQTHRPESKVSRPDKNMATSPEPQKLFQPIPPTPKQTAPPILHQIPEKTEKLEKSDKIVPQKPPISNPEVPEKELPHSGKVPLHMISYMPFETFETNFELAIKNKQNKGNLPSRKIDIYLNKESNFQNDFYAVKNQECDSMDSIGRNIQSLMVLNNLMNDNDISLKVFYYTMRFAEKKASNIKKKNEPQIINFIMIMELAENNLADEMWMRKNKKTPFSKFELYSLAENLIRILTKLEKLKIPHGNLKPENFLLVKGKYKLADFNGTIYEKSDFFVPSLHQITTKYVPDELKEKFVDDQEFEINYFKLDVFSLGLILLECSEGNDSEENTLLNKEKISERINKIMNKYDSWFINLLQIMLEIEESIRTEIGIAQELIGKFHEEIQKLQYEVKKPKGANPKKEFSKTTAFAFNTKKKEEPLIKKFDKPKLKGEIAPRKIPNRSNTPESPLKDLEGGESRYSSVDKKKNKVEVTHSKVTSYVSPRAQKNANSFKFPVKNEAKKTKSTIKSDEMIENRDMYKEFLEKLNKINNLKSINFTLVLSHFTVDELHYDRNIFYQKYTLSADAKIPKKIVSENKRKDGKVVRFYSDHSQEIVFNNGAKKMVFPDSYSIITFVNNDIKQTFPYEMTIYYYADSQTTQVTYEKAGINIYQFKNEQLELHHSDGRIEIRLADGTEKHLMVTNTK